MVALGVDVGYGRVKSVVGERRRHWAATWSPAGGEALGIGSATAPLLLDGRPLLVGDRAAARPGAHRPFGDGRLSDLEAVPLLAQGLWEAGVQGDVVLGSGMPLGFFPQEREAARRALLGRTFRLGDGRSETTVRIARLVLRPQGVGAALWLLQAGRLPKDDGYVVVLDVGTRTVDVLTCDASDMTPVDGLSFSLESGLAAAAGHVAARAQAETGHLPAPDLAERALLGEAGRGPAARWYGRALGGAGQALDAVAGDIRAEVARRFGPDAGRVAAVAIVGGGGVLLGERLAGVLPGAAVALTAEEALFANALGFAWAAGQAAAREGV